MKGFTARQPILNRNKDLVAYEILYRNSPENYYTGVDGEKATSYIALNLLFDNKLDYISNDKMILINFPSESFLEKFKNIKPNNKIVIEILEDIKPTHKLYRIIKEMSKKGYKFALDDFVYNEQWNPFLKYIKLIKFDIQKTKFDEIKGIMQKIRPLYKGKILAEKIETYEEFEIAKKMDFNFFQGFFFSRPEMLEYLDQPFKQKSVALLYYELNKPDLNFKSVSNLIKMDVNVAYKFLKYVNNLYSFDLDNKIKNIHSAVVYAGENNVRYFLNMIVESNIVTKKPIELHKLAVQRSWFCYYLARSITKLKDFDNAAAMLGLFSCLDAILDKPIENTLGELPIMEDIKEALIFGHGKMIDFIKFYKFYESGEWDKLDELICKYNITEDSVKKAYLKSIKLTDEKF